jgi:chemotaxis regulatin CheY-phosphate phosphatase CheZ
LCFLAVLAPFFAWVCIDMSTRRFVAYFDCLGFECIIDATDYAQRQVWAALSQATPKTDTFNLNAMVLRARFNPQRSPEIWMFDSELDQQELDDLAESQPQILADCIRKSGVSLYRTSREKRVIE